MSDEDLPPESVSRKEYDKYSDVWCVAIVLWKILSSGKRWRYFIHGVQNSNIRAINMCV